MTLLDQAKKYYQTNHLSLDAFLETTTFLDSNPRYPSSIVIQFGKDRLIGKFSVWQNEDQSYLECEYVDLTRLDKEPTLIVKDISSYTLVEELTKQFEALRKLKIDIQN